MAVVWAKQAGNLSTATIWAFWNESTQQIEDYGQVPQANDYVYLNGFTISFSLNQTFNIGNGTFTNKLNPYTNLSGGIFSGGGNYGTVTLIANIEVGDYTMFTQYTNGNLTLNIYGNVTCDGAGILFSKGGNGVMICNINGNLYRSADAVLFGGNGGSRFSINGNLETYSQIGTNVTNTITINGNLTLHQCYLSTAASITSLTLNGNIYLDSYVLTSSTPATTNINGHNLYYRNLEPLNGLVRGLNLVISADDFTIHRQDNSGQTVIFSKYTIDNTAQYPLEANVTKDVVYAYGAKIGQLEPVTVTNTNTINVYPYKKRQ